MKKERKKLFRKSRPVKVLPTVNDVLDSAASGAAPRARATITPPPPIALSTVTAATAATATSNATPAAPVSDTVSDSVVAADTAASTDTAAVAVGSDTAVADSGADGADSGDDTPDTAATADTAAASTDTDTDTARRGTARAVETMLKEFSGGDTAVPAVRSGGRPSGMYDQLWQLSMADPHTGLANQLLLLDRLTQALARRRRHGGEVVVCHIDLDNLGEINLDLGYTTGNTVLCEIARRLTSTLRTEDTVGRVGGSELVVVLAISDEADVEPLMRRLQHSLGEPVQVGGQGIRVHAAMGVVLAEDTETAEVVLARADRSTRVANH